MGFGDFLLICVVGGVVVVIVQMIMIANYKKAYMLVLKTGKDKSECIALGRRYYKAMGKSRRKKEGISDIETRIVNDLHQYHIAI